MATFTIKVFYSIDQVPKEQWNRLVIGHSSTFSHEFWEVVEKSKLNDFDYRYVMFFDESNAPVALACLYSVTTDLAIFAPAGLRTVLGKVRRMFPNFLKLRMLECGTPITLNSPPFAVSKGTSATDIIASLSELLVKIARAEGQFLIVVRDFEPNADMYRQDFERLGYHWVDSLPNTYMEIEWTMPKDYVASMKSYYRSKLLKHLRKNKELKITHELRNDFHEMADTLCDQWLVVHHQADEFQREVLTPAFYSEFSKRLGSSSKVLLFYRQNELVGHALLYMDGELLRWLYFGRNDARNDSLYIYVGYTVIETAILLGAKQLELGLTTYSIKQDLGAHSTPMRLALRSASRLINPFVGIFYPLMNHIPEIRNKHIFKESAAT